MILLTKKHKHQASSSDAYCWSNTLYQVGESKSFAGYSLGPSKTLTAPEVYDTYEARVLSLGWHMWCYHTAPRRWSITKTNAADGATAKSCVAMDIHLSRRWSTYDSIYVYTYDSIYIYTYIVVRQLWLPLSMILQVLWDPASCCWASDRTGCPRASETVTLLTGFHSFYLLLFPG